MARRLVIGRIPDPARAHGAWVYLIVSVLAGALSSIGGGFLPALLAGTGFAGLFLLASAGAIGIRRAGRRLALGIAMAALPPLLALQLGADPAFFLYGISAILPAGLAAWFAERRGFQSPLALAFGVAALVVAAPSAACAGGATLRMSALLLGVLLPFFAWRTIRIRNLLARGGGMSRAALRAQGLREVVYAVAWTFLAVLAAHLLA